MPILCTTILGTLLHNFTNFFHRVVLHTFQVVMASPVFQFLVLGGNGGPHCYRVYHDFMDNIQKNQIVFTVPPQRMRITYILPLLS